MLENTYLSKYIIVIVIEFTLDYALKLGEQNADDNFDFSGLKYLQKWKIADKH